MNTMDLLATVAILFVLFVAPLWVVMHYRSQRRSGYELTAQERAQLGELAAQAERMADRIDTLEAILDAETPDWRRRTGTNRNKADGYDGGPGRYSGPERYKEVGS